MYNTSSGYKENIRANNRPYDEVYGTITFSDSSTLNITPSIIPENGITWVRQCIDSDEIEFGGVYLGTIEMSLITDKSRYAFYGARLELNYRIKVNDAWEVVPIGVFTISEADRPDKNTVKFTAYDDMRLLDVNMGSNVLQGTPYIVLQQIASATGYSLAFNSAYVTQNFVNANVQIQLDKESGITTYREAVKCVCQLIGAFAQDDRTGKMELRKFSQVVNCTLTTSHWYSATIADYLCNYVALSVTGLKGTFNATSPDPDEIGNLMEISDAPAWDYGVFAVLQSQTNTLFDYLHSIAYTPCSLDMPSDPSFDCGDRLELETSSGDVVETLITSFEWKWHGGMEIESKGVNPYLQGDSTTDIKTNRLITRASEDSRVYMWHFTNPTEVSISDGDDPKIIGRLRFSASADTDAMFVDTIQFVVSDVLDEYCRATITYSLNDVFYDYEIVDDLTEGKHIVSLNYPIGGLQAGSVNEWKVYVESDGGTLTLPEQSMRATIWGQGLRDLTAWDGKFELADEFEPYVLGRYITNLDGTFNSLEVDTPVRETMSDTVETYVFGRYIVPLTGELVSLERDFNPANIVDESGTYNIVDESERTNIRTEANY